LEPPQRILQILLDGPCVIEATFGHFNQNSRLRIWNGAFTAMIRSLAKVICDAAPIMSGEFKKNINGNWRGRFTYE